MVGFARFIRPGVFLGAALAAGCLDGTELVIPPREAPTTFTLRLRADSADAATAAALGWGEGIPDVAITLAFADSADAELRHLTGTAAGTLVLDELAGGRYVIHATRWLTEQERSALPPGDDAVGFVASVPFATASSGTNVPVNMVASRKRGLVLSEWHRSLLGDFTGSYEFGGYIRIYNNGDTTIHLDGMVFGMALAAQFDGSPNFPCSSYRAMSQDPQGIWARSFHRLPGSGSEFPLRPGETAVIATDAIDHSQLVQDGLDLRQATIELEGPKDADNPSVPNAPEIGLYSYFHGHGIFFNVLANVVFLAAPLDPASLVRGQIEGQTTFFARIPAEKLIEVVAIATTYDSGRPECERMVHWSFDRLAVKLINANERFVALRRRVAPVSIDARAVLQHSRTAAWDFTAVERAPFHHP